MFLNIAPSPSLSLPGTSVNEFPSDRLRCYLCRPSPVQNTESNINNNYKLLNLNLLLLFTRCYRHQIKKCEHSSAHTCGNNAFPRFRAIDVWCQWLVGETTSVGSHKIGTSGEECLVPSVPPFSKDKSTVHVFISRLKSDNNSKFDKFLKIIHLLCQPVRQKHFHV